MIYLFVSEVQPMLDKDINEVEKEQSSLNEETKVEETEINENDDTLNEKKDDLELKEDKELSNPKDIKSSEPASLDNIEHARQDLYALYKKSKKLSNIILVIVLIVVIACFILVAQKAMWMKIIGYVLGGLAILTLILYYFLVKNKFPTATRKYIEYVNEQLNGYVFESSDFTKALYDPLEKIDQSEIMSDRVYMNVSRIGSRNVVIGTFKDKRFKVSDLAVYFAGEKNKQETAFVGKYITASNSLKFDGRYVINVKGLKPTDLPTDITDLTLLDESEDFVVYGPDKGEYKQILTTKFISAIKNIKVDKDLLNLNVVVWGGHTAIYISYTDAVIALPFQDPFKKEATEQYRKDLLLALQATLTINK